MKKCVTILIFGLVILLGTGFAASPKKDTVKKETAFEEVVKDAKVLKGLFNLYRKNDSLYLEIQKDQFNKQFLYVPTQWSSAGPAFSGWALASRVFTWEKLDKKILLKWVNTRYTASKTAEYRRAMNNVIPETIVHAFKIESAPHKTRGSYLINPDDCFFSDMAKLGKTFSSNPKHRYSPDRKRTFWGNIQAFPQNIELEVRYTLTSSNPLPDEGVPDPSVFTVNVRYSISSLPGTNGYKPRLADDRVGYFMTSRTDFDKTGLDGSNVRYINRWHLEKKEPGAPLSEVKKPIVFWLENTIPKKFRKPIRDGVLEWNKAFEKIGFKNVLVVKEMPDDAQWDPADIRYNTVRWVVDPTGIGGGAYGPRRPNPLTGEILDADIVIWAPLQLRLKYNATIAPLETANLWQEDNINKSMQRDLGIIHMLAEGAVERLEDVPESYFYSYYKDLVCHEVGHTLGLRHNFKGSTTIPLAELHNKTQTGGIVFGNSVMDYLPVNLAPKGVEQGEYFPTTIGVWDYFAIEYGYKPIDAATPEQEFPELKKIAERSNRPELVYGTDEDARDLSSYAVSIDPTSTVFDLSDDPLGYSRQQAERIRDLWRQLEKRALFKGESYVYLRDSFSTTLTQYYRAMSHSVKWIGGIYHSRSHVGDAGGGLPFRVVEYDKQRRALDLIKRYLLSPDNFGFEPSFLNKLQNDRYMDYKDYETAIKVFSTGRYTHDFSLTAYLQDLYSNILRSLYDPLRMQRIIDNEGRVKGKTLTLGNYLEELHSSIWQEVSRREEIGKERRILQRAALTQLTQLLISPKGPVPGDALSLTRYLLKKLSKDIGGYLKVKGQAGLDLTTRAHLENCLDTIGKTLEAGYAKKPL